MYLPTAKQYHQAPSITGNCSIINCNWFSTLWAINYSSLNPINYVRDVHVIMYDQNSLRGSNYRPNNKYINYLKTVDVFIELSLNWDEMWSLLIITQNRSQNPSKVRKIQSINWSNQKQTWHFNNLIFCWWMILFSSHQSIINCMESLLTSCWLIRSWLLFNLNSFCCVYLY